MAHTSCCRAHPERGPAAPQAVSRPQVWCQYPPSEAVEGVVAALEEPRQVVARLQAAASVACPIAVDLRLSGAFGCQMEG